MSLSVATVEPKATFPMEVKVLERHEHSSQTFVPLHVSRYLVLATLDAPGGGPDLSRLRAFVARAGQGVTYAMGTWHHPVTVLDGPASFAVFMWRDGTPADEEFVPVTTPLTIAPSRGAAHDDPPPPRATSSATPAIPLTRTGRAGRGSP